MKLKLELLLFMVTWLVITSVFTFFILKEKELHKGLVDYYTDRLFTHLRLTINLISTFCTKKFNFLSLLGIQN